ncbi:MAG: hypothetical protein H0U87_10995 [Acidobacteria bacterium]|jgi:hypothetical protein|nr:hypothetical protein [Acidobacteriota bacterium]
MLRRKRIALVSVLIILVFGFGAPQIYAKGGESDAIVRHLKTKYQAKKVKIPFMFLARLAVGVVRPAGVKSFSVTIFENLKFSPVTLDAEMRLAMRNSLSAEWSSLLRIRSRGGEQVYLYMREAGKSVRLMLVTIEKQEAVIIRATFNPEKLAEFVNNPKIFGISLSGGDEQNNKTIKSGQDPIPKKGTE